MKGTKKARKPARSKVSPPAHLEALLEVATSARSRSYSPYSGHKVGAAIRTRSGRIYPGCNVENSSYGGTVCAERVAIQNAIAHEGRVDIEEILVVTDATPPWPPCGLCRQVISEFATSGSMPIHSANLSGDIESSTLDRLLPSAFTPEYLKK